MQDMQIAGTIHVAPEAPHINPPEKRRNLIAACLAHVLHDGYTDQLYALLPVWQEQFGLSYAGLAAVRALYYGSMSGLQIPGNRIIRRVSARTALALSTLVAAMGFLMMALPLGFGGLCLGLVLAGIGSSVQHPRASLLVTNTYGTAARGPLGIYNFSGDLGKATLPAIVAVLLPVMAWRPVVGLTGLLGIVVAFSLFKLVSNQQPLSDVTDLKRAAVDGKGYSGFALLMTIGVLDTAVRMGFLLFLPFLVLGRGGTSTVVGLALALLFVGGALGKATCNRLTEHFGIIDAVIATEMATALLIAATLFLPLTPMLALLPLLGFVLNGTSSVLYGTVPELAPGGDTGRAFAYFYTIVSGSSGLAPIAYGLIADHSSQTLGISATALTAALIAPLALALRPALLATAPG
jgi:FSR family fosmidomycin resistance protein-like MFS transporter